jgi:hypothetical protein
MEIESLVWDVAEFIVKPVSLCRGFIVRKLAKLKNITYEK